MSLLPNKTYSSPNNPLYATVAQLQALSTTLSTINISTAQGAGVSVSEPLANNFVFTNALSNAGGISFVSVPGSSTLGLSNAGVTGLVAGSGISVSGATGNVTVANTGVNAITAGTNITLCGSPTNPVINAVSAALSPNVIRDQFVTNPSSTNSVGGAAAIAATVTGLTPGKVYLFNLNGAMAGVNGSTGEMITALSFPGIGEVVLLAQMPNSGNTFGIAASAAVVVPAGQTTIDLEISGSGVGGGDTITLRTDNFVVTQLN